MGPTVTQQGVKDRGWTMGMIRRFLGEPATTVPNRRNRSSVIKLYDLAHVERVEQSDEWKEAKKVAEKRQDSALCGVVEKIVRLNERVMNETIRVVIMAPEELRARAIEHYNLRATERSWRGRNENDRATDNSEVAFLTRIEVNFIRHNLTRYDELLDSTTSKVGTTTANAIIARRIFEAIALAYPHLQAECDRQLARKQVVVSCF